MSLTAQEQVAQRRCPTIARTTGLLALACCAAFAQPASIPTKYAYSHGIPPRLQWEGNYGYCGETSLIANGSTAPHPRPAHPDRHRRNPGYGQRI